jgi:hypothetical protein
MDLFSGRTRYHLPRHKQKSSASAVNRGNPSTKSSQMKQTGLVLAYEYMGCIKPVPQLELLFTVMDELGWTKDPLFRHANGLHGRVHILEECILSPSLNVKLSVVTRS